MKKELDFKYSNFIICICIFVLILLYFVFWVGVKTPGLFVMSPPSSKNYSPISFPLFLFN